MNKIFKRKIILLGAILILVIIFGVLKGSVNLSFSELFASENRQILHLRLVRVILAIIAGSGLSVCGIALQAILRNPLAEPYLLGTSSGAGLAAVIALTLGLAVTYIPFAAFIGAILSTLLVYYISRERGKIGVQSLILSGIIVSIAFSAIILFLLSTSEREALHGISWWLWGNLEVFDFKLLSIVGVIVAFGIFTVYMFSQDLNAISIGEEEAVHLGINVELMKKILLFLVSLITAAIISVCGVIGFVGLVIPHMSRLIIGPNHKLLIPVSCVLSSAFMILCDSLARTIFAPSEIPIGVITAIVGAPIFIILLKKSEE
ncbi:MAG: iron ABC transporter permease [Candidatus Omnitrophica bacterium]|jgi:iron complex transport system permease protein|nr:iron ABC transporter permease [Candidatus Omnitrophota bacterium]